MSAINYGRLPARARRSVPDAPPRESEPPPGRTVEPAAAPPDPIPQAAAAESREECLDFVRFCYRRRPVAWPELYHEMCAVAARGSYRGMGYGELYDRGIALCLWNLPKLVELVELVVREGAGDVDTELPDAAPGEARTERRADLRVSGATEPKRLPMRGVHPLRAAGRTPRRRGSG